MPNKLTDAEVKKALECYRGQKLFAFNGKRPEIYIHDIIDLINRQEALIDKLEKVEHFADKTIATLQAENESLKAEVERLNNNISAMATTLSTSARATRHEAYKEYHKKFEKNIKDVKVTLGQTWEIHNALKKTLNELVGDLNGKDG